MLQIFSLVGFLVAGGLACVGWQRLQGTTLRPAALWLLCATCVCAVAAVNPGSIPTEVRDQLSLLGSLLLLCPPVFGLGARRPVNRVWPWFVMLPMLLAFGLPALTVWREGRPAVPLELETPALAGIGLATVMSCGNWLGTRFTLAALLYSVTIGLLAVSVAVAPPELLADRSAVRAWSGVVLGVAAVSAWLAGRRSSGTAVPRDRLWCDFRDTFGMVWARRMMDRVNHTARAQNWSVRLHLDGFHAEGDSSTDDSSAGTGDAEGEAAALQYTLGWLLKRFVDESWVSARLPHTETGTSAADRERPVA